jgi:phosphoribosylformylglycinamidine synthase
VTASTNQSLAERAIEFGLSPSEYEQTIEILEREPNITELGIFSVMWSEHCSYKSSKKWLRTMPTKAPWVVCGPGENAGVVDIGGGKVAVFKMESHNHPSFIEPYQGAATGVGGILRDVFTMGARPVANLNSLRFGSPNHAKTRHLVSGVVAGVGGYGNCVGVPTVGGECTFHESFNGNNLVNAMTVGIADAGKVFYSKAAGLGNPVVYVGSKTGRDGIHGATMASAVFGGDVEQKRPTVQVGDPFTEKLLIEACLELMETDVIIAIQDMGAAGLTSSAFEMAGKGGLGMDMDLDQVPQREDAMSAYEIMLSESQERMLMVLREGTEDQAAVIFEKWELDFAVIARLTDTGRLVLRQHGDVVADMPIAPLAEASPEYDRPWTPPEPLAVIGVDDVPPPNNPSQALKTLLASPDLASKRWIWEQYDHTVMADTVGGPGGDAAIVRVHGTQSALAITTDCTPRYCQAGPRQGGRQAVAEAWRNLTAVGALPLAITDCLNFGNPERPEIMGQFVGCIEGISDACKALDFPVVSGNVSLYNESDGQSVQPVPAIGGIGLINDLDAIASMALTVPNGVLVLIGDTIGHLGASLYLREIAGREEGAPPEVDLEAERRNGDFVRRLIQSGRVTTCHDVADGGVYVAVAEMAMVGGTVGANVTLPDDAGTPHGFLFGEDQGRYVLAVREMVARAILKEAKSAKVPATLIGNTGGDSLTVNGDWPISVSELRAAHEDWLPNFMTQD